MSTSVSQEPALVGSVVSNNNSAKRTDEWPSRHNQAGRSAKRQSSSSMPKDEFTSCTAREVGNADLSMVRWDAIKNESYPGGSRKDSFNSTSPCIDSWNKPVIWARKEDGNTKGETAGWPRWETASYQNCEQYTRPAGAGTCEDDSTMACKRGWNESDDGNAKRVTVESGVSIYHDGWRQLSPNIHMVGKGSLSKSACWDRPADGNGKQESGGWPRRPGAMSKTTGQCTSRQDDSTVACKRGWSESGDGKEKREIAEGGDAFHDGLDGWRQSNSNIHKLDKGNLSKSAGWDQAKDVNVKSENDGWPRWPGAMSKTIGQFPRRQNRKVGWQSREWTASDDGELRNVNGGRNPDLDQSGDPWMQHGSVMSPKCDWNKSVSRTASNDDSLDRDHRKWGPGLDQTGGDPWRQISPTVPPKVGRSKFESGTVAQGENSFSEKIKWSAPDFGDQNALKQNMHTLLPKFGGKRLFRGRSRTPFHGWEHGHYQSNDTCKKGAGGVSAYYTDSPSGRSRRGSQVGQQIGDAVRQYPDRYIEKFRDGEKSRCLGHDSKLFRNDMSCDGFLRERCSHHESLDDGECPVKDESRDDTIKYMVTTPKQNADRDVTSYAHVWKSQQKPYICQRSPQNLGSPTDNQNDHTTYSPIQFGLDMQVGPQLPSRTESSNQNGQRQQHASNPKDEVQNHEQQAMLNEESFKKNDNIRDTSSTQDLNVLPVTALSSLQPFSSTVPNKDSSSSNLRSRFSPASIEQKAPRSPVELKASSKKPAQVHITVAPSDKFHNTSAYFVKKLQSEKQEAKQTSGICDSSRIFTETMTCPNSKSWNACHSEPVDVQANNGESNSSKYDKEVGANGEFKGGMDDKGIRMFKFALAEFVKEIIKPVWKEGRLSKEAHKTVVKKVVDKVVGVLGTNIPQTQERIDLYLSYSKDKLHKLVQDYLEMFINT